jgi:hypothetical protein
MEILEARLPLYLQMIDPTLAGPADAEELRVFAALNSLGVIAVRPILLSIAGVPEPLDGMRYTLRLVVRRIIVGNLGTGNVERRLGEAARKVKDKNDWRILIQDLRDLNPNRDDFVEQLRKRSFNKGVLAFLRRSILERTITPSSSGILHYIWTRQAQDWESLSEEDGAFWASTIGNTFLASLERRPKGVSGWNDFKGLMFPHAIAGEWLEALGAVEDWNANTIEAMGSSLAAAAGEIWYDE